VRKPFRLEVVLVFGLQNGAGMHVATKGRFLECNVFFIRKEFAFRIVKILKLILNY
jgi:hypothetical protein